MKPINIIHKLNESANEVSSYESFKKDVLNDLEVYYENLENDEDDVFGGTEDSYANEMLTQNLFDTMYYHIKNNYKVDDNAMEAANILVNYILDAVDAGKGVSSEDDSVIKDIYNKYVSVKKTGSSKLKESVDDNFDEICQYVYSDMRSVSDIPSIDEVRGYADVTPREYNKIIKSCMKAYSNVEDHHYGYDFNDDYIELNDNHTIWELRDNGKSDEEWWSIVNSKIAEFKGETGVDLYLVGRSGRHACVDNNYYNALHYDELREVQERLEREAISEFNGELEESSPAGHKMNMIKYSTDGYTEAKGGYYKGKPIVDYDEKDFKKGTSVLMPFACGTCGKEFYVKSSIHDFFRQGDFDDPYEVPIEDFGCPKCKENNLYYSGEVLIKEPGSKKVNESVDRNFDLPEGYPQEVYDKYFEYTKDLDLVDDEPLDFNEWYAREYKKTEAVDGLYIYSNAESEDKSDAVSMIDAQYSKEAPNLKFRVHNEGSMWFVDFIGTKEDIKNYLVKLGWYNPEEIESSQLIKPYSGELKESADSNSLANFIKDSVEKLQNTDFTNCKYNLDDRLCVCVGWSDGYDAEDTSDLEIHSKDNPTYCINAAIKVRNDADFADLDYMISPYYEHDGDVYPCDWIVSPSEDYVYLADTIMETYKNLLELLDSGEVICEGAEVQSDEEDFKTVVLNDFKLFLDDNDITEPTDRDVNDYFTGMFYDAETEDDIHTMNAAEEIIRTTYNILPEVPDDDIFTPTADDIEEMQYWYYDDPREEWDKKLNRIEDNK